MNRIKLFVTGHMEERALHRSLSRFFPETRAGSPVVWLEPTRLNGMTSGVVDPAQAPTEVMMHAAKALVYEAVYGKREPSDLVVLVDDLEIANISREHAVCGVFTKAVQVAISGLPAHEQAAASVRVRERCCFHLLKPMAEAYFFGDTGALRNAGVRLGEAICLVHATDVEAFETNDARWLPVCVAENAAKLAVAPWWKNELHPKRYLEFLVNVAGNFYDEGEVGQTTLGALDWLAIHKGPGDAPVIRALFQDISNWFGVACPVAWGATHASVYPTPATLPNSLTLRNM